MALTKKQKLKRIMGDFELFTKNFVYIIDNNNDKIKMKLNLAQIELNELTDKNKFVIVSKARQGGISTYVLAKALYRAITNENENILIVSYKQDSSKALFEKLKSMNQWLPRDEYPDLFPETKRDNRDELLLENGSRITCIVAGNKDIGRGSSYSMIHLSEFAFYSNQEKQLLSAEQSLLKGDNSRLTIETTSNGIGNLYYRLFMSAYKGNSKYKSLFISFTHDLYKDQFRAEHDQAEKWHKEYYGSRLSVKDLEEDEKPLYEMCKNLRFIMWRRWKLMDMELEEFYQEYPSSPLESFISSGENVFNQTKVLERLNYVLPPLSKKEIEKEVPELLRKYIGKSLFIYHLPKQNMKYYGGIDVSAGGGGDDSTMTLIDQDGEEVCTFFNNKVPVYEYAEIVDCLGRFYNYAFLAVERNNVGTPLLERLRKEYGYLNLYKQKVFNQKGQKKMQLGWQTTQVNKSILIQDYKESFEKGFILIHTKEILEQMQIYVEKENKKMGNKGGNDKHDDLVISAALSVQAQKSGKWYV